ncbi:uncharacterized protein BJ171DRAFT_565454 [Polychytrium aggregatum]|uniref:uncharacterized protein n=1 Tax=Polychytrium aggregatum TaxID=110093 RepID=UPI0022FF0379|nr:uncharacterized protein BJ171DRAFT_565454 [Polychytrium aggregatum]KAI9208331.1 hypothetical protein BJ171DRAFT_565454 [Polychytrium aggregatum]
MTRPSTLLLSLVSLAMALAGQVIELTTSDFSTPSEIHKNYLVEFYSPMCQGCLDFAPYYETLAEDYAEHEDSLVIAKYDSRSTEEGRQIAIKFGITTYPAFRWFSNGLENEATPLPETRNLRDKTILSKYLDIKLGKAEATPEYATALTPQTWDSVMLKDLSQSAIVMVLGPGCPKCDEFEPIFQEIAREFSAESGVIFASIDGSIAPQIMHRYRLDRKLQFLYFASGTRDPLHYEGPHTKAALVKYINEHSHTQRSVDGGFLPFVGRPAILVEQAQAFASASDKKTQQQIYDHFVKDYIQDDDGDLDDDGDEDEVDEAIAEYAPHYAVFMKEILAGNLKDVPKEIDAVDAQLEHPETLKPEFIDALSLKRNILRALVPKDPQESETKDPHDEL